MSPFREIRSGSRSLLLNYAQTSFFYAKTFEREIIQRRQGEKRLQMRPLVMIDLTIFKAFTQCECTVTPIGLPCWPISVQPIAGSGCEGEVTI